MLYLRQRLPTASGCINNAARVVQLPEHQTVMGNKVNLLHHDCPVTTRRAKFRVDTWACLHRQSISIAAQAQSHKRSHTFRMLPYLPKYPKEDKTCMLSGVSGALACCERHENRCSPGSAVGKLGIAGHRQDARVRAAAVYRPAGHNNTVPAMQVVACSKALTRSDVLCLDCLQRRSLPAKQRACYYRQSTMVQL